MCGMSNTKESGLYELGTKLRLVIEKGGVSISNIFQNKKLKNSGLIIKTLLDFVTIELPGCRKVTNFGLR